MARDKRFRYDWTPERDAALIEVYRTRRPSALKGLSIDWGIPQSTLYNRALYVLKVTPFRTQHRVLWTDAEDALLVRYGHERPVDIQRRLRAAGFRRGLKALINHRAELKRRGLPVGAWRETFGIAEIAEGMGCAPIVVGRWIKAGLLAATAMTPNNPQAQSYQVTPQALRRFCLTHTQRLMQLHPDIVWYTDLISGGKKPASTGQHPLPAVDDREYPLPLEIAHAA